MKVFKLIISVILSILIFMLVILMIFNIFFITHKDVNKMPNFFTYKFLVDITDSMDPTIKSGSMIIIQDKRGRVKYEVGDVVTYRDSQNDLITHRITDKTEKGDTIYYSFAGDSNNEKDFEEVDESQIEGKLVKVIPILGSICLFLTSSYGQVFLIVVIIAYIILLLFMNNKRKKELEK